MQEGKQSVGKGGTRTRAETLHERRYRALRREFARGNMMLLLEKYLAFCGRGDRDDESGEEDADAMASGTKNRRSSKRTRGTLPNPAGFCRFYGISRDAYGRLESDFPTEVGRMRAVFEDEALNSELSATVLGLYLKFLLGATLEEDGAEAGGDLHVTFEHDILSDGR